MKESKNESEFNEKNYSSKMDKSILSFKKDISTLRTGRANTNMLDTIKVDVYGQLMPIDQLAYYKRSRSSFNIHSSLGQGKHIDN